MARRCGACGAVVTGLFEVREIVAAWQGGEVIGDRFEPVTARYSLTKAGRKAAQKEMERWLTDHGVRS